MQNDIKWVVSILCALIGVYGAHSVCLSAYGLTVEQLSLFWVLNTTQGLFYTIIVLEMCIFTNAKLSGDGYMGIALWFSLVLSHCTVPLQWRPVCNLYRGSVVGFSMKIYTCLIFIMNAFQAFIFIIGFLCFLHRLLTKKDQKHAQLSYLLQDKSYRVWLENMHQLCRLYASPAGIRHLIDVYLPKQEAEITREHYCEPIVMAYIFAVCTWVIPADDTVWIRETCEICSSVYKTTETILVNHEGQHLHEYCARRWFPSLKDDVTASKEQSTRVFDCELFGRWVLELPRLSKLRDPSHQQLPRPRRRR